ncbi:MAG TPA: flavin reductase family protein [Dongiaceae bacterium]|nr:flavin reductase family protein [Dongiaceae bacterium]
MNYNPNTDRHNLPLNPFKSCTIPRPIGWLSSISVAGVANLAPYSQWQNLTFDPPMVMFAANQYPDGRRKDTVLNAEMTGWFVWNMATYDLREAVNASASAVASEIDEFTLARVTKAPCVYAPCPRVLESPIHFECRYLSTHRLPGNSPEGTVDVVFAKVERIHIRDDAIGNDGKIDVKRLRPIARLGYYDYTVVDHVFEMRIPGAGAAELAGLEGAPRVPD